MCSNYIEYKKIISIFATLILKLMTIRFEKDYLLELYQKGETKDKKT